MIILIFLFIEIEQYVIDKENLTRWHDEIFYQKRFRRGLTSSALSGSYRFNETLKNSQILFFNSNFSVQPHKFQANGKNCSIFSNLYFQNILSKI